MFSLYKYLIVSLVFSHLGFWSGNLFLIAPFPDLCLLVPFCLIFAYLYLFRHSIILLNNAKCKDLKVMPYDTSHINITSKVNRDKELVLPEPKSNETIKMTFVLLADLKSTKCINEYLKVKRSKP